MKKLILLLSLLLIVFSSFVYSADITDSIPADWPVEQASYIRFYDFEDANASAITDHSSMDYSAPDVATETLAGWTHIWSTAETNSTAGTTTCFSMAADTTARSLQARLATGQQGAGTAKLNIYKQAGGNTESTRDGGTMTPFQQVANTGTDSQVITCYFYNVSGGDSEISRENIGWVNATGEPNDPKSDLFLGVRAESGTLSFDWLAIFEGHGSPTSTIPPVVIIVNSSWNITSLNTIFGESESVWNTGGEANITSNLLSFVVETNELTNMSCAIDEFGFGRNYTEIIANNSEHKSATTETTDHASTVLENISLDSHCLYCGFIDVDGIGAESGCLNFTRKDIFTSLNAIDFNISDFQYSSTSFIPVIEVDFNSSQLDDFVLVSSFNANKDIGGVSTISFQVLMDDAVILESEARTLRGSDVGVTGIPPLSFKADVGSHNLTINIKSSTGATVNISNIDFNLLRGSASDDNDSLRFNVTNVSVSHSDRTFISIFNWTMGKEIPSLAFITGMFTVAKTSSGLSIVDYFFSNRLNSSLFSRGISASSELGTISIGLIDTEEISIHEHSLFGRVGGVPDTITVLGRIFDFDLRDNQTHLINSFNNSNINSDFFNNFSVESGKTILTEGDITIKHGSSVLIYSTLNVFSDSGDHNPIFSIEGSSGCKSNKQRSISSSGSIGNIFFYFICPGLDINTTYSFNLTSDVEPGESLVVVDEYISGFEVRTLNIATGNLPPFPNSITNPLNNSEVKGIDVITWLPFSDPNDDLASYNISILNLDRSFNFSVGTTVVGTETIIFNWLQVGLGNVSVNVEGIDDNNLRANSTIEFVTVVNDTFRVIAIQPVNETILTSQDVSLSFNVTENANSCDLFINNSLNSSLGAVVTDIHLFNISFPRLNQSYNWRVECNSTISSNATETRFFSIEFQDLAVDFFTVGKCPDTIAGVLMFTLIVVIALFLILIAVAFRVWFMGFFGSLMLLISTWYFAGCMALFSFMLAGICIVLIFWFVVQGFFRGAGE